MGATPSSGAKWIALPLKYGRGVYQIHSLSVTKTGTASSTFIPHFSTENDTTGLGLFDYYASQSWGTGKVSNALTFLPTVIKAFESETDTIYLAPFPNAYGDTYNVRLRVRRLF